MKTTFGPNTFNQQTYGSVKYAYCDSNKVGIETIYQMDGNVGYYLYDKGRRLHPFPLLTKQVDQAREMYEKTGVVDLYQLTD